MKRRLLFLVVLSGLVAEPAPIFAQTNNNEYTPLGSRIRQSRPFPNEPRSMWRLPEMTEAQRSRSRTWVDKIGRCMWDRSNEKGLDLLERTDFGFQSFRQIGIESDQVDKFYPLATCMSRAAASANSGILLRYTAAGMRSWYLQAAYFSAYKDGPSWIKPGYVIDERSYPLSQNDESVQAAMDLADCVVAEDPHGADYFFRTAPGTDGEKAAIENLVESISPCIPQGQQIKLHPTPLRLWIGEGLWHASRHSVLPSEEPAPVGPATTMPEANAAAEGDTL